MPLINYFLFFIMLMIAWSMSSLFFSSTPWTNSTFHCNSSNSLKLITRLRLGSNYLLFHKFKHSIQDTLNPTCISGTVETTIHYLLHCPNFSNERLTLFSKLQSIDENILSKDDSKISKFIFFGNHSPNHVKNTFILTAWIEYINPTKRFDAPLYQNWHLSICLYAVYF